MKLLFLLLVLTRNDAGDVNAAFVNTATASECAQKKALVEGIFLSAGVRVIESKCMESKLRFSKFAHASSSAMPRHFYLITAGEVQFSIKELPDWRGCMKAKQDHPNMKGAWCASSVQKLLE